METTKITANIKAIRSQLPEGVKLEAAAKTRSPEEVKAAIDAGIDFLGYNYVQEGIEMAAALAELYGTDFSETVQYNLIGHLQKNKINKALGLYKMIETIDSISKVEALAKRAVNPVDVLIQVNIGEEDSKSGTGEAGILKIAQSVAGFDVLNLCGLMAIEPYHENSELSRPYFKTMKGWFDRLKETYGASVVYLSMGMSNSWQIAVEEGATVIRVGTAVFGPRN